MYNLDFRVLLGRLGADKKDFYNLLEQIITFLLLFAGWKKNDELPSGIKIHLSPLPILWERYYLGAWIVTYKFIESM